MHVAGQLVDCLERVGRPTGVPRRPRTAAPCPLAEPTLPTVVTALSRWSDSAVGYDSTSWSRQVLARLITTAQYEAHCPSPTRHEFYVRVLPSECRLRVRAVLGAAHERHFALAVHMFADVKQLMVRVPTTDTSSALVECRVHELWSDACETISVAKNKLLEALALLPADASEVARGVCLAKLAALMAETDGASTVWTNDTKRLAKLVDAELPLSTQRLLTKVQ